MDPEDGTVLDSISISGLGNVDGLGHSGQNLYATNYSLGVIYKIDFDAAIVTEVIDLGLPFGGGISYGGTRNTVFVADFNVIYEINPETSTLISQSSGFGTIYGLGYSNELNLLFVADVGTGQIRALNPDTWETVYSFAAPNLTSLAADESSFYKWLTAEIESGEVPPGESVDIPFQLNASNLFGGDYQANIFIHGNDPANTMDSVSVELTVNGVPIVNLDQDTLMFQDTFIGGADVETLEIENAGTDELNVQLVFEDDIFSADSTSFSLAPLKSVSLDIFFQPETSGDYSRELLVVTNDDNKDSVRIRLLGAGLEPPVISVLPDSIGVDLFTGDSISQSITIGNSDGGNPLIWRAEIEYKLEETALYGSNKHLIQYQPDNSSANQGMGKIGPLDIATINSLDGSTEILAWIGYADFSREYPNTLNAISQYYTNYSVDTTSMINPTGLSNLLVDKDVFLIPEQESGSVSFFQNMGTSCALVLEDFVSRGGAIIMCGSGYGAFEILNSSGLMSMSQGNNLNTNVMTVEDTLHRIMAGLPGFILGQNATFGMTIHDESEQLVTYNGYAAVAYKEVGRGFITYLGYDYFNYDDDAARIIANAVSYGGGMNGWLSLEILGDTLDVGETQTFDAELNASGLFGGLYQADIIISNNDPLNPEIIIPVLMDVTGVPMINVETDSLDFGYTYTGHQDSLYLSIVNEGTDVLEINLFFADEEFISAESEISIPAQEYYELKIFFDPDVAGIVQSDLLVVSNDSNNDSVYVVLTGHAIDPPVMVVEPDSLNEELFSGSTSTQYITIDNSAGGSDLIWEADFSLELEESSLYVKHSASMGLEESYIEGDQGLARVAPIPMDVINSLGGRKNILALTTYADLSREYPNTLNAIAQYFTDFNIVSTNTTDPVELDSLLDVSDIFLIPEQEGGSASYFNNLGVQWAGVLGEFLNRGGSIILCGADPGGERILNSSGLMSINVLGAFSSGTLYVENQDHFITEGIPETIGALNATFMVNMPDASSEALVTYAGEVVVGTKPYGQGQITYIGFDYFDYNDAAARLIANTVANTGKNLQWLSLENTSDTIPAGSSSELIVSFDASGQYAGGYDATISIASNDPAQSVFNVPVHLDVIGAPNILIVQDTLIFSDTYVGYGDSLMLEIVNDGTDSLFLTFIPQNPDFSTGYDSLYILPGESEGVNVFFHPTDPISYDTHLLIISNDPDDDSLYVNLIGQGVAPPVISITPDSVSAAVFSNDSTIQSLTIDNTLGGSVLNYSIMLLEKETFGSGILHHQAFVGPKELVEVPKVEPILMEKKTYSPDWERKSSSTISGSSVDLEDVRASLDSGFWEITSLIPSRYNFSGGETGTGISDGGNDMYDGGNYLSTNFGGSIEYTNGSLQSSPYLANKDYFTAKYPGLFVLAAETSEIDFFTINGNLGADGGGSLDESVLQVSKGGRKFLGFVKRVYDAWDPSVNHLIIVEDNDIVNHEISTNTNDDYHQVNDLEGIDRLYYLLYAGSSGLYIDDSTALVIMNQFLDVINEGDNWLSLNKYEGSIQAGETEDLDLTFNATGLYGGLYEKDLLVQSNDPASSDIIVPVSLTVTGAPDIVVSTETIDFGTRFTGSITTKTFTVSNEGTDTLFVSDIVNANAFIDVDIADFELAPEEEIEIAVTYSPALEDSLITHLFIESNDPDQSSLQITLVGNAIDPPVMNTSPDSVGVSLYTGQQATETITIDNSAGGSVLEVTLELAHVNRHAVNINEIHLLETASTMTLTGEVKQFSILDDFHTTIPDSLSIALYGSYFPTLAALLESYGYYVSQIFDGDILGDNLLDYDVLIMTHHSSAPLEGVEEKIAQFLSKGNMLITEWSSSSLLFSEVGPSPYNVVTPQWGWFEGAIGNGDYVSSNNPIYHSAHNHPLLYDLPDPFTGNDGTEFFFTVSGYDPSKLIEVANYNGHGGNWPAILNGNYNSGQVVILLFDAADNPVATQQLWLNAVSSANANFDWISLQDSALSVPAGEIVETHIDFNAFSKEAGQYQANLKVSSNDPENSEVIIPIAMDVIAASDIELDVEELGFGDVLVGASISRSLIVHNNGSAPLNFESIYSDRADFLVTHFPSSIEPGGQGIVQLEFRPISSGHIPGVLTIESNDIDEGSISIDLYGTGVPPPVIEVTPVTISEHLIKGESVTRELVISNEAGNSQLFYHFSDTNISWLTFSPSSDSIDAGDQSLVDMYISTDQLEIGHYTVPIKISSNDPNTPTVEVPLHLRVSGIPDIGISVSSISFGEVVVGDTALAVVEITNTGPDTLKINDITITNNQFLSGLGSNEIPPYDTTTLTLSFAPQMSGLIMSEISIVSNDPNESVLFIQVQGEGVIINVAPIVHDQEFEVPENSPAGYIIGKVEALDPNGDNVTFSLTDESSVGTFEITGTGEIVVSNPEALDFESNSHFVFTVVVSDGQLQDSALVSITVLDVNERPSISDQSFEMNENSQDGFQIGSVTGDDPDGDLLSFSIVSGNAQDAVTLNSQGILSINDSSFFDFETHHTLSLIVEVSDGALKDSANVTISVLDVEEPVNHAPVILDQIFTVEENADSGHEIGQVIASDEDDDELSFSIISGNDFGTFGLDPTTGILTLINPEGSDFIANSTISFIVEVSDGEATDLAIVNIDIAEEEVVLSVDENALTLKVYPNPTNGFINISGEEMIKSVELIGGSGQRLMFRGDINSYNHRLDVKTMSAGVYYLVIEDQAGKNIKRVIIE
ncbi:MAG: choice-of-anchor D domain-containing protein [Cyclobacteriaceae bacterium]|nr:choice-of-anchor D domain-containing protein [Cyclobacteriaceae bacterium SS2]